MAYRSTRRRSPPWRDYSRSRDHRYDDYHEGGSSRHIYRSSDYRQYYPERHEDDYRRYEDSERDDRQFSQRSTYNRSYSNYHPYSRETYPSSPRISPRQSFKESHNMSRRDDRSATPPLPPSPSPSYLALAEELPSRLPCAVNERKLLILDLNGTLVYRSPHQRAKQHDTYGHAFPRLRPVHPRPYMPTFRSYLFAPETKAWLDVMIWSSAQPHSVADMVERTFKEKKEHLLAIWARDTLGLSDAHYHRKVQTIKDLKTPWKKLPNLFRQVSNSRSQASAPRRDSISPGPESVPAHSALTTLLLDDSPKKAVCQPYNHVCLPEYSGEVRTRDLAALSKATRSREADLKEVIRSDGSLYEAEQNTSDTHEVLDAEEERKRRQKEKKLRKKAEKAVRKAQMALSPISPPSTETDTEPEEPTGLSETLLAVIGVLEEIKVQKNVAAWIRSGGLWVPHPKPEVTTATSRASSDGVEPPLSSSPGNDAMAPALVNVTNDAKAEDVPMSNPLWFEHQPTVDFWVARGREALQRLRIPIIHGVER